MCQHVIVNTVIIVVVNKENVIVNVRRLVMQHEYS